MKTVSQQVTAAYHKHETDWILPNGRRVQIVAYRDALEIAQRADKRIAELELKVALLESS